MTTLAAARSALVTATGAKDDVVDPPGCMVFSEGADFAGMLGDGSLIWRFRILCYVAASSDNAAGDVLMNAYLATQVAALMALSYWRLESVGPTGVSQLAGGDLLAANITVSTYVTLS